MRINGCRQNNERALKDNPKMAREWMEVVSTKKSNESPNYPLGIANEDIMGSAKEGLELAKRFDETFKDSTGTQEFQKQFDVEEESAE